MKIISLIKPFTGLLICLLVASCTSVEKQQDAMYPFSAVNVTSAYVVVGTLEGDPDWRDYENDNGMFAYCASGCTALYTFNTLSDLHIYQVAVGDTFQLNTVLGAGKIINSKSVTPSKPGIYYYGNIYTSPAGLYRDELRYDFGEGGFRLSTTQKNVIERLRINFNQLYSTFDQTIYGLTDFAEN